MYSLLAPSSQAVVDSGSFIQRYNDTMNTAAVRSVRTQPLGLLQEGDTAEFGARVTLESEVVGEIVRDHTMQLVYEGGRWGVVWDEGLILPELSGGNRLTLESRVPSRGNIYDVEGKALAYQGNAFELGVIPGLIENEPGLLAALGETLNITPEQIKEKYATAQPDWYVPIGTVAEDALQGHALALEPFLGKGLATPNRRPSRLYSETNSAAHVIGYMGPIPAEEVADYQARGYTGDEAVGIAGLEAWGEEYLNGERGGVLSVVDPAGQVIDVVADREPQPARSIYTTLDLDFQAAVEGALADAIATHPAANFGAVAVLDPFHVVKLAGHAVDEVRRRVQQEIYGHRGRKHDPLYRIRNILHAGAEHLSERQQARLEQAIAARRTPRRGMGRLPVRPTGPLRLPPGQPPRWPRDRREDPRLIRLVPDPRDRPARADAGPVA